MDIKYIARLSFRILVIILLVAVVGNVCYHVVADGVRRVETAENVRGESVRSVSALATAIRSEQIIEGSQTGVYLYSVDNGERVHNGKNVLDVYADTSENKALIEKIDSIEDDIFVLESARTLESSYNSASLEKKLNEYTLALSQAAESGDLAGCDGLERSIRILICVKELKNGHTDYKEQLRELQASRESALAELGTKITSVRSSKTGYFYYNCDGYEGSLGSFDPLTADLQGMRKLADISAEANENAVGKLVTDHKWYFVLPLSSEESMYFSAGGSYKVNLGEGGETFVMKLERLVRKTGQDDAYLVLSCGEIAGSVDIPRRCSVEIEYERSEGFRIPVSAIRYLDGYTGVYVLMGSVVEFRRVEIIALDEAYVICNSEYIATDGIYKSLKSYDQIIVKGEGLYVGKIID